MPEEEPYIAQEGQSYSYIPQAEMPVVQDAGIVATEDVVTENATDSNGEDVIPPETFVDDSDYDYEAIPDENDSGDEETEGESEESQTDEIAENE